MGNVLSLPSLLVTQPVTQPTQLCYICLILPMPLPTVFQTAHQYGSLRNKNQVRKNAFNIFKPKTFVKENFSSQIQYQLHICNKYCNTKASRDQHDLFSEGKMVIERTLKNINYACDETQNTWNYLVCFLCREGLLPLQGS